MITQQQAFNISSCQFTGKQSLNNAAAARLQAIKHNSKHSVTAFGSLQASKF
jgi:hypothetical protein